MIKFYLDIRTVIKEIEIGKQHENETLLLELI